MERRVETTGFQSNSQGGGGAFYRGRAPQKKADDEEEAPQAPTAGSRPTLGGDVSLLGAQHRSTLGFGGPVSASAAAIDFEAQREGFEEQLEAIAAAVGDLEDDLDRRRHLEIGSVTILPGDPRIPGSTRQA